MGKFVKIIWGQLKNTIDHSWH